MFLVDHLLTKWLETKRLKVEPQRCVRARNRFSSCDKCSEACPAAAISLKDGLEVQEDKCTECMKCTVSCPSEALYDEKYPQYFKEMPNREIISFSCENNRDNGSHIKLACLAQLDRPLLIYAMNKGQKVTIQFDEHKCRKCVKFDESLINGIEKTINSLNAMLKEPICIVFNDKSTERMERSYSRRDLLSFYSKKMTNNVVSPLMYEEEKVENLRVSMQVGTRLSIYQKILDKYQDRFLEYQRSKNLNTVQLIFTGSCDGCTICSKVCTTGALSFVEDETEMRAIFQPSICNGCLSCIDICNKNGLKSASTPLELSGFLEKNEHEVLKREYKTCTICGDNHVSPTPYCEDCSIQQRINS